ncbi:MAG TPA: efflux RND transporter periplasmic adaptor subunit [Candidatus Acidoferrales bacterium]|nr:efflux RND transporter periplasmic adaptor subunit [Candidatus Acidoferrales bacterium]
MALAPPAWPQTVELVPVVSRPVSKTVDLPGELQPFLSVSLHAKVAGYVERVLVDRGSQVKPGDLLVELSAPELAARIAEAESQVHAAESSRLQAEAQLAAAASGYERLRKTAETPGAVSGNELIQAQKQTEALQAGVESRQQAVRAAQATVQAQRDLQAYLRITAPFAGVVTDRLVHPGALAGPGNDSPLLVVQQISHLRLIAAVPEEDTGSIVRGARVQFRVPAYPGITYSASVARPAHMLEAKTRTMPVELDVLNPDLSLAPGMYAEIGWPVRRSKPALMVPKTAVVTTSERTFVIREKAGRAEWVDVRKGAADGDAIEVTGNLHAGDRVVRRASDELREGAALK